MSTELTKLIEEEQAAMEALDDARKRAGEVVQDAGAKAKAILEAAGDESAVQTLVEERSLEIDKKKKDLIDKAEARSAKLAELAERNLDGAVRLAIKEVLGSDV